MLGLALHDPDHLAQEKVSDNEHVLFSGSFVPELMLAFLDCFVALID